MNIIKRFYYIGRSILYFLRFRRNTMVFPVDFVQNLMLVYEALENVVPRDGAVVECGTWRGGMAAALVEVVGPDRRCYFFDSFEGLPPPEELDGLEAAQWAIDTSGDRYFNNCTATLEEFRETFRRAGVSLDGVVVTKGWYGDTLPQNEIQSIAILRLDSDWFNSTYQCLEHLWPKVLPGGLVIIDDYYCWVGCRRAVHRYLSTHDCEEAVRSAPSGGFAYIWKHK